MSGYSEDVQNGKQESDAHARFIHKPYTPEKLRRVIADLIHEG